MFLQISYLEIYGEKKMVFTKRSFDKKKKDGKFIFYLYDATSYFIHI
jgi:hypothetical protein